MLLKLRAFIVNRLVRYHRLVENAILYFDLDQFKFPVDKIRFQFLVLFRHRQDLEEFIAGSGESGFIYVSMGSSVKAAKMPEHLRQLLIRTFAQIPYRVIWKFDGQQSEMKDLPPNVKIGTWLPQQDILGHRKLRAFVTHGGLLSMFESVYHGVPLVTMPVFCDHDANAAKAEADGYALKLELETLTTEQLGKFRLNFLRNFNFKF